MTLDNLRDSARRLVSKDLTVSGWPDASLDAAINEWYREVTGWVFEAMGTWEFKGDTVEWNLSESVAKYAFPSDLVALNRLEVKYDADNDYVLCHRIDDKEIDTEAIQNGSLAEVSTTLPGYRLFGNAIYLYPIPTEDVTGGLFAEIISDVTDLSEDDDLPVINPLIHKVLAVGAAFEYASSERAFRLASMLEKRLYGNYDRDSKSLMYQVQMLVERVDVGVRQRFQRRRKSYR